MLLPLLFDPSSPNSTLEKYAWIRVCFLCAFRILAADCLADCPCWRSVKRFLLNFATLGTLNLIREEVVGNIGFFGEIPGKVQF